MSFRTIGLKRPKKIFQMKTKKLLRIKFREAVMLRDKHKCKVCGRADVKLDAHHITDRHDMPNGGYVKENGIALCDTPNGCHFKAEQYHTHGHGEDGFSPDDLYNLIGSSRVIAEEASKKL